MYVVHPRPAYPGSRFTDYHVCESGQFQGMRCDTYAEAVFVCEVLNNTSEAVLNAARAKASKGEQNAA